MKKIEAIVRPEKIDEVRRALESSGYPGITITQIEGHGKQKGVTRQWRGEVYKVDLLPKAKLEIVASDKDQEKIIAAITIVSTMVKILFDLGRKTLRRGSSLGMLNLIGGGALDA